MLPDLRSRVLDALGSGARRVESTGASLERALSWDEPPRTQASPLLSDAVMRAYDVGEAEEARFGAFVDGVQESHAICWLGVVPVVWGRTGAVVRARINRRLVTWGDGPIVKDAVYVPTTFLEREPLDALTSFSAIDTSDPTLDGDALHPQQLLRCAMQMVRRERESHERELAEQWCRAATRYDGAAHGGSAGLAGPTLYIDGGLPSPNVVLTSRRAVGVIKSHRTLYAAGSALPTVLALRCGERSSIFSVETRWRARVASWYLRIRDPKGHEPLWGLVRIEVSLETLGATGTAANASADEVSRWILAESAPLSLPDSRWDTMAYGIRDCEVFLRAAMAARRS